MATCFMLSGIKETILEFDLHRWLFHISSGTSSIEQFNQKYSMDNDMKSILQKEYDFIDNSVRNNRNK